MTAFVRPDGRCFVREPDPAALAGIEGEVYATVRDDDEGRRRAFERLGFAVHRRELEYVVPTDAAAAALPRGFRLQQADEVDEHRLRLLDDALRQDVPGSSGWRWSAAGFHAETFAPDAFDPATYLVAVDETSGEYVGLARVWHNRERPRLGMIAVLARYRRRGLARALLAHVFAVLYARGTAEVTTEVDETNVPSRSLLEDLGARRVGGYLELRRPPSSRP